MYQQKEFDKNTLKFARFALFNAQAFCNAQAIPEKARIKPTLLNEKKIERLNRLTLFAHYAPIPDHTIWQNQIRKQAFSVFTEVVSKITDPREKLEKLTWAKRQ